MDKMKSIPKFTYEIIITIIVYIVLVFLWNYILKEYILLSDSGLSTIGLSISTAAGVLTAILASFVLLNWQTSRQGRNVAYLQWRSALQELIEYIDANLETLWELKDELFEFTTKASGISLIDPMPRNDLSELKSNIDNKSEKISKKYNEETPSEKTMDIEKALSRVAQFMTILVTANFEHHLNHSIYKVVLSERGLIYRLLIILMASILVVAAGAMTTTANVSDIYNAPIAILLILWFFYGLFMISIELKKLTRFEEYLKSRETNENSKD